MYFTPKRIAQHFTPSPGTSQAGPALHFHPTIPAPQPIKIRIFGRSLKERRRALAVARIRIARERVETAATAPIPLPAPPTPSDIHDYKGWYELFGIQPNTDYLRPNRQEDVMQRLKETRIGLALQYHRDHGGSDKRMTQLNVAWDQLKEGKLERWRSC